MILNEFSIFLAFVLIGIIISFIFDFFRILRRVYKTPDFITILEDIAFWLISGIILLLGIFVLNNGNIRASIRSRGPIINEVASQFGGGGHIYASGVKLKNFDEVAKIVAELDKVCKEYNEKMN